MKIKATTQKFAALCTTLFLGILAVHTPLAAKDWENVRIGVEGAYPPFSKTEADGSLTGFDIDIAFALCKEIGAKCTLVKQDWDGMIPALLGRRYDAIIASMSITEERKKKVDFTNKYYSSPASFVGRKGRNFDTTKGGLKGVRIGVQGETIMDRYVSDNFPGAKVVRYGTQEDANLDLIAGRVDLVFSEVGPADSFLDTKEGKKFRYFGDFVDDPKWFGDGIGIAVRKQDSDLKAKLNEAIKAIRKNGTYDRIQSRYFNYDIYGG